MGEPETLERPIRPRGYVCTHETELALDRTAPAGRITTESWCSGDPEITRLVVDYALRWADQWHDELLMSILRNDLHP